MKQRSNSGPVTVRFNEIALPNDKFAMANARMLENMIIQTKPQYTKWKDPLSGKVVLVVERDFFDLNRSLFEALPEAEIR